MSKERQIKQCKSCGKDLDKSAKICPSCGKDQRNFFGKHKILTGLLAIVVLVVAVSSLSPKEDTTPVGTVSAVDLTLAYDKNEIKAAETYKDKYYEVTGVVGDIDAGLGTYMVLEGEEDQSIEFLDRSDVQCFFNEDDKDEISKLGNLKKGDKVTVIGKIGDKVGNVSLNDAKIK